MRGGGRGGSGFLCRWLGFTGFLPLNFPGLGWGLILGFGADNVSSSSSIIKASVVISLVSIALVESLSESAFSVVVVVEVVVVVVVVGLYPFVVALTGSFLNCENSVSSTSVGRDG